MSEVITFCVIFALILTVSDSGQNAIHAVFAYRRPTSRRGNLVKGEREESGIWAERRKGRKCARGREEGMGG